MEKIVAYKLTTEEKQNLSIPQDSRVIGVNADEDGGIYMSCIVEDTNALYPHRISCFVDETELPPGYRAKRKLTKDHLGSVVVKKRVYNFFEEGTNLKYNDK